jgi:hypothetical protein
VRRDDSVFFFTLVDFLLTTTFFALVVYAIGAHRAKTPDGKTAGEDLAAISKAAGVSDLTELTDDLTRLGPIRNAMTSVEVVKHSGGSVQVARTAKFVEAAGGYDSLFRTITRLRKQNGFGAPPCLFVLDKHGKQIPTEIAVVQANDSEISFLGRTPVLDTLLGELHLSFNDVRSLTFGAFRDKFSTLRALQPGCLYSIRFEEHTRFVDARDAAQTAFRLDRVKH